jgi:hypothetical protein
MIPDLARRSFVSVRIQVLKEEERIPENPRHSYSHLDLDFMLETYKLKMEEKGKRKERPDTSICCDL